MWPFASSSEPKNDDYRKRRWCELWKELVPPAGEAETWQGELLRIVANAEDEANRNGFVNWDEEDDREIDLLVEKLCADSTFDPSAKEMIKSHAARIKKAGSDTKLSMPTKADWEFLHFRVIDWCDAHPDPIAMPNHGGEYVGRD